MTDVWRGWLAGYRFSVEYSLSGPDRVFLIEETKVFAISTRRSKGTRKSFVSLPSLCSEAWKLVISIVLGASFYRFMVSGLTPYRSRQTARSVIRPVRQNNASTTGHHGAQHDPSS